MTLLENFEEVISLSPDRGYSDLGALYVERAISRRQFPYWKIGGSPAHAPRRTNNPATPTFDCGSLILNPPTILPGLEV